MSLPKDGTWNCCQIPKRGSNKTFSNLVKESYPMRRKFITEEAESSKEILDMCPYFGKSTHVS